MGAFKDAYFEKAIMLISTHWSCPIIHLEAHRQKEGKLSLLYNASIARPSQPWMLAC